MKIVNKIFVVRMSQSWNPLSFQQIKKQYINAIDIKHANSDISPKKKWGKDIHCITREISEHIWEKPVFGISKINGSLNFISSFKGELEYVFVKCSDSIKNNEDICLKFIDNPTVNPYTGRKISKNGVIYNKLQNECKKIYPEYKKNISFTDSCTCQECGKVYSLKNSEYKLYCNDCQNNKCHTQVQSLWGYSVDIKLLGLIDILNKHGIETSNSCQCTDNGKSQKQIWISFNNYASFNLFISLCHKFNNDFYHYLSSKFVDKIITLENNKIYISIYFDNKDLKWFYNNILFLDKVSSEPQTQSYNN